VLANRKQFNRYPEEQSSRGGKNTTNAEREGKPITQKGRTAAENQCP